MLNPTAAAQARPWYVLFMMSTDQVKALLKVLGADLLIGSLTRSMLAQRPMAEA
jgi:hypothetical protein